VNERIERVRRDVAQGGLPSVGRKIAVEEGAKDQNDDAADNHTHRADPQRHLFTRHHVSSFSAEPSPSSAKDPLSLRAIR
jgi:hypothetical protein